ncbi:MAG TPA: thioredoxin domain-containing protein [Candidatus Binataceae bacterium]|jgi:protein-disulfide isomerase
MLRESNLTSPRTSSIYSTLTLIGVAIFWSALAGCSAVSQPAAAPDLTKPRMSVIPASTLADGAHYVRGDPNAPVTIVEFADYECPYCADNQPALRDLLARYDGQLRLIYRDYETHSGSLPFAEAARCAGEQDAFWKMNEYIFDHQPTLDPNRIGDYATVLGLDSAAITSCVASRRYEAAINSDGDLAAKAGAEGTPTFFVNGRLLDGAQSYDQLSAAVASALASAAAVNR